MIRITVKLESGLAISLFVNFNKDYCNTDRWFCGWFMHHTFQVTKGWASDLTIIITCSKKKGWFHYNVLCRQKGCQCNNKQNIWWHIFTRRSWGSLDARSNVGGFCKCATDFNVIYGLVNGQVWNGVVWFGTPENGCMWRNPQKSALALGTGSGNWLQELALGRGFIRGRSNARYGSQLLKQATCSFCAFQHCCHL